MNVPQITMEKEAAQTKLEAYRVQLHRRADAEYEAVYAGYAALAEGRPLINLTEAFNHAGLDGNGRPRLAIARADRKQVQVTTRRHWARLTNGMVRFDATSVNYYQANYQGTLVVEVQIDGLSRDMHDGYALVPMVPADVRPSGDMKDFFVLWEVEEWADTRHRTEPDRDPYLLKHLAGDLYIVVAEWDLTDLERAIMAGRRDE